MTETEIQTQGQKTKISKLAIASLILATPVVVMSIVTSSVAGLLIDMPGFARILLILLTLVSMVLAYLSLYLIKKGKGKIKGKVLAIGVIIIVFASFSLLYLSFSRIRVDPVYVFCQGNLRNLKLALYMYMDDNNGRYPTAEKWCDLLKNYHTEDDLVYHAKRRTEERCSYAFNPNCEPNSPADVVLLFETQGGWNQHGGQEILNIENHPYERDWFWGYKTPGCNVMFNDGHVEFVLKERFHKLKWKAEENESGGKSLPK